MTPKDKIDPKRLTPVSCWRHYGGFVFAGILATLTDATMLAGITRLTGQSPLLVRPIGIATGMVVSWLVNRTITFGVRNRPTVSEFLQFAAVSWSAQVLNYAAFVIILAASAPHDPTRRPFCGVTYCDGCILFGIPPPCVPRPMSG